MADANDALRREMAEWVKDTFGDRPWRSTIADALLAGQVGKRIAELEARNAALEAERDDAREELGEYVLRAIADAKAIAELKAEIDELTDERDIARMGRAELEAENTRLLAAMTEA